MLSLTFKIHYSEYSLLQRQMLVISNFPIYNQQWRCPFHPYSALDLLPTALEPPQDIDFSDDFHLRQPTIPP